MTAKSKKIKIILKRSICKIQPKHKKCISGLGLRRINHSVVINDNPCVQGMIKKVSYLVLVEDV